MARMTFAKSRQARGLALAMALAVLMVGAAIQPVGAADSRLDQLKDYCESKGGWLVGENGVYYCHGDGFFEYCEVISEGSIVAICIDMMAMYPEPDNSNSETYPPFTRPDNDSVLETADMEAQAVGQASEPSPPLLESTAAQKSALAERED